MRIRASFTVVGISALAAASSVSASVGTPSYIEVSHQVSPYLVLESGAAEVLDLTNLAAESVFIGDGENVAGGVNLALERAIETPKDDAVEPEDADPVFDADKVLADSVTVVEARVKVFTDFIDFDPADADVDATPVTISEADAKDVTVGELADNDDVTVSEDTAKSPEVFKADAVAATDAAPVLHPQPAYDDTVTASEAIDDFDVGKVLTDSVTVTEAIENEVTIPQSDSVTAVQSSLKTFNSSVDFDPSDDDVDPDPINVSEAISEFDFSKGLTDTATATESDAKEVTVAELADNDATSVTESIALDPESVLTDSLTAVEGIKLNPELAKADAVTMAESNTFDVRPSLADATTPTDAVDDFDIELVKADTVNVSDVSVKNFTENVDFDRSDADADADPVNMSEQLAVEATVPLSDSVNLTEAPVFEFTNVYSDAVTAAESIDTLLTLGDSEYMYPDYVHMDDGSRRFVFNPYSYTISSTEYFVPNTGVIGAAETLNSVMLADQFVTTPEDSGGLVVNFHYTDVDEDDRALGGYYFNQTPINAGNSTTGARTIL